MTKLTLRARKVPLQMHIFNFHGNLKRGYFDYAGRFYSSALSLENCKNVIWLLVPCRFKSNLVLAWPHYKTKNSNFVPLVYKEMHSDVFEGI